MCKIITDIKHIEEVQRIIDVCDNDDESDVEAVDDVVEDDQPKNNTDVEIVSSVCVIKSTHESSLPIKF